jgi:hypothetical protein
VRLAVGEFLQLVSAAFRRRGLDLVLRLPRASQPEGDVLPRRSGAETARSSGTSCSRAAVGRDFARCSCPSSRMAALGGRLEARQHAHQRGLAAARGAEQGKELAGVDVEVTGRRCAVKSPNRLVTPRIRISGFASGSSQGAKTGLCLAMDCAPSGSARPGPCGGPGRRRRQVPDLIGSTSAGHGTRRCTLRRIGRGGVEFSSGLFGG